MCRERQEEMTEEVDGARKRLRQAQHHAGGGPLPLPRRPRFRACPRARSRGGGQSRLAEAREALGGRRLDVAVVDLSLPDGDGTKLTEELRRSSPGVRVVVLSATVSAGDAEEVLRAGADAVLDKVRSYSTIAEEVRRLADR